MTSRNRAAHFPPTPRHDPPLEGHQNSVNGVAFSDTKLLASASSDNSVRLWDAATGQPIGAPLEGHQDSVLGVAFSPDGKRLASASGDSTVRLWDVALLTAPLIELVAKADALCPLSNEERARFGLADPKFSDRPKEWTAAQRRACGLDSGSAGGAFQAARAAANARHAP
jgi:WD domain, G-beta repeat